MPSFNQLMDTPVDVLELSTRTHNCLRRADFATIGQVLMAGYQQLKAVRNLGDKSLEEVIIYVCEYCKRQGYDVRAMFMPSDDYNETFTQDDDNRRYF
ncbi:MAG: DNA-directed RNA polymerase subunit alpha C-terminal domain-containing protein [Chloroflexota bacterium]|jgi:DNA-directed RNA polymerase alpha subunit